MNNYYAVDRYNLAAVRNSLATDFARSTVASHTFALLDTAFDHGSRPLAWPASPVPLYTDGRLAQLRAVSPALLCLATGDSTTLERQIATLLHHCNGRPMLSFVQTDLDAPSLVTHWQHFLEADTGDGEHLLLRWADTRALPGLARSLHVHTWRSLTHPIRAWTFIDRRGQPQQLTLPATTRPLAELPLCVALSATELTLLLQEGEPDAVIQAMHDATPHLLPQAGRSAFYDRVAACCAFAARHGIEAFNDVLTLAVADALSPNGLLSESRLLSLLEAGDWQPGALDARLIDLLPEEQP